MNVVEQEHTSKHSNQPHGLLYVLSLVAWFSPEDQLHQA